MVNLSVVLQIMALAEVYTFFVMHCIVSSYTALYRIVLYCIVLYGIALYCIVLY